jgi:hypothetical protein
MVQVAKNRYASEQYHDFIGFKVSKSLLERVFPIIYGAELEKLYFKSINTTVDQYRAFLEAVPLDPLPPPNRDLDDGRIAHAGEYSLADHAYAKLLARLSKGKFERTTTELRADILSFYSDLSIPFETKKDKVRWQGLINDLEQLKSVTSNPEITTPSAERPLSSE